MYELSAKSGRVVAQGIQRASRNADGKGVEGIDCVRFVVEYAAGGPEGISNCFLLVMGVLDEDAAIPLAIVVKALGIGKWRRKFLAVVRQSQDISRQEEGNGGHGRESDGAPVESVVVHANVEQNY